MSKEKEIRDSIRKIAGVTGKKQQLFVHAQVVSVGEETCVVKIGNLQLTDVRLSAVIDGNINNLKIKPKVNSTVLLADLSGGDLRELVIIAYSEIDTITINGGFNGGLVMIEKLVERLNNIEQKLKTHQHAYIAPSELALTTPASTFVPPDSTLIFENTKVIDIENPKISH